MSKLKDKVAIVTGGNSGIGLGVAKRLRQEGARVAIFGRNAGTLAGARSELGGDTLAVQGDVTRVPDLARLFEEVATELGPVDVLVNNAGIAAAAPIEAVTEEQFDQLSDINFKGLFFTVQQALPRMKDGGSIVLVSSSVNELGMANMTVYAATKAAVRSLARGFAAELAPRRIRVNSLSPGPIETPIFDRMGLDQASKDAFAEQITAQVPMGRFGSVDEVASAALFLASPESSYVTGADLVADGGLSQI